MESVGEKLKASREARACSLDQAARDTHISKRFLEALEEENFSVLPGDSYVVGFLRSYSEYLGLDSVEIVNLFRNLKLQEQPAPLNELIVKTGMPLGFKILILLVLAIAVGVGGYFLMNTPGDQAAQVVEVQSQPADGVYVMSASAVVDKFAVSQVIRVPLDGQNYDLSFAYKDEQIKLNLKDQQLNIEKDQENVIDLNSDGKMDFKVMVKDVNIKVNPVQLTASLDLLVDAPQSLLIKPLIAGGVPDSPYGSSKLSSRQKKTISFPEFPAQGQISCSIIFDMPMVFRYEDEKGARIERMSTAGEVVEVKADKKVRMWFANGGMVSLAVGSRTLRAGSEGEIVAWELSRLSPDAPGQLALIPLY